MHAPIFHKCDNQMVHNQIKTNEVHNQIKCNLLLCGAFKKCGFFIVVESTSICKFHISEFHTLGPDIWTVGIHGYEN